MVKQAITCNGVENIVNGTEAEDIFSEEFEKQLEDVKMPMTKFNALMMLLKSAIKQYKRKNKTKGDEFDELLKKVVEKYNNRDNLVFTNEVVGDFVDSLSDELINIFSLLNDDKNSFEKLGISFEEKAFYDILVRVRDTHKFDYADEKCILLAKDIKQMVDDKAEYVDWSTRNDIKDSLRWGLNQAPLQKRLPTTMGRRSFCTGIGASREF